MRPTTAQGGRLSVCALALSHLPPPSPPFFLRIDADVQLVAPTQADLERVRVRAQVYKLDPTDPSRAEPALDAVEYAAASTDFWPAVDGAGHVDRADAGFGGLVQVRALDMLAAKQPVALWSAEAPNVYVLVLSLVDGPGGAVLESESAQVGLRTVDIVDRQLRVNGRPIMIKGVNRHEHDAARGKATTDAGMVQDIKLMKQFNFNAVRCSHYPNAERW